MLKALVEEINRYGEEPQEALKMLNVKMEYDSGAKYSTELVVNGIKATSHDYKSGYTGNPLTSKVISVDYIRAGSEDDNDDWDTVKFSTEDLTKMDSETGVFVFTNDNAVFTLSKIKQTTFDYYSF